MAPTTQNSGLTDALEDYLETVFELVRDRKVARIKDIAEARGVQPGSVSPAMKRLAELGLIEYRQREFIDLTPAGDRAARRVYARHQLLGRFFEQVLELPHDAAQAEACAMEHSLSDQAMDQLVRFFEYLHVCPQSRQLVEHFHECPAVHGKTADCGQRTCGSNGLPVANTTSRLSKLKVGAVARVALVEGAGAIRQRLLDMGILPDVKVTVERVAPAGDPIWIRFQGTQLSLRRNEARAIVVEPV